MKLKRTKEPVTRLAYASQAPEPLCRLTWCYTSFLCVLAFAAFSPFIQASEQSARFIACEYTSSREVNTGNTGEMSERELYKVISIDDRGSIRVEASGGITEREYEGKETEVTIEVDVEWGNSPTVTEILKINRFTGRATKIVTLGDRGTIVYEGDCEANPKRKF